MVIQTFVRWFLTLLLIWGAYLETGLFTAMSLIGIFIATEIIVVEINKLKGNN